MRPISINSFNRNLRVIIRKYISFLLRGNRFYCPICNQGYRRFRKPRISPRPNALCPGCGSLERHRLLWITLNYLWSSGKLSNRGTILHIAPEPCLSQKLMPLYNYYSIDKYSVNTMLPMDIESLAFHNDQFDAIICNHVLEHVIGDRLALNELFRVLKAGGWACIQVPMKGDKTFEDKSITDPNKRETLFGQKDHVRQYGYDFKEILIQTGFELLIINKNNITSEHELEKYSLGSENEVFFSLKK